MAKGFGGDAAERNAKLLILALIVIVTYGVYAVHLFTMQGLEAASYQRQSRTISSNVSMIAAQRGEIFDRNATIPMVINSDSFAVDLTPAEIPDGHYDAVAARLARFLNIAKRDIDRKVPGRLRRSYTQIEIRVNVPFETIADIAENINDLPGVSWRSKPLRNYVETGSIAHVVGYVGDITREELKVMYNKNRYTSNSIVGKTGIEKQYDELLQGEPGREIRTVDVRGRVIDDTPVIEPPQMGKNLVLTIDTRIQKLAEETLGSRVGAAVVLRPADGEVLAMVSYPYYNQNIFNTEESAAQYNKLVTSENNPLLNRAVNAVYPPASTFKVIMMTALLAEKSIPPEKKIECDGHIDYGGRRFNCHVKWGHGWLDMKNSLAQSCDVYFWVTGRDNLGVDRIASYAKEFGFGQSLGIDLPAKSDGFVPTAQWKERRYHATWLGGDTMNMSIGQGYMLTTPLHVANMMAMVVNGGKIYRPHLLKEVRDPATNEVIEEIKPQVLHEMNVDELVWKEVQRDLRYVITDGTPQFPMNNKKIKLAGKTGTAEVAGAKKDHWHSWMVAYGPYDAPVEEQLVVAVLVEAVNEWEWWAPYATNIIFQGVFQNQTYEEAISELGFNYLAKPKSRQE